MWSLEFRMISRIISGKHFVCRLPLFIKGKKQTKKSVILWHFSNLKYRYLFITADVLNSARFHSILFCEKFEITSN